MVRSNVLVPEALGSVEAQTLLVSKGVPPAPPVKNPPRRGDTGKAELVAALVRRRRSYVSHEIARLLHRG